MRFDRKFRDNAMTWPSLRIDIHIFPWHWKIKPWWTGGSDDMGWSGNFHWLFFDAYLGWNNPPFTWEGDDHDVDV